MFLSSLIFALCPWTAPRRLRLARHRGTAQRADPARGPASLRLSGRVWQPGPEDAQHRPAGGDGVRYTNSFCAFPVCTPSRYSLLSGRYVHEHAGWDNRSTLSPQIETFPRIFRAAGYRTKAVGKMHFTPTYLDVGFDELLLAEQDGPGRWDDDYHRYLMRLDLVDRNDLEDQRAEYRRHVPPDYWDKLGALVSNLPEADHSTTWIADRAVEAIRSWDVRERNLLMVGFIKPHHPVRPAGTVAHDVRSREADDSARLEREELAHDLQLSRGYFPNDRLTEGRPPPRHGLLLRHISQIDHHVGRLTALLKEKDSTTTR